MSQYPRVFGLFREWWRQVYCDRVSAESALIASLDGASVVELIPAPEVAELVAAAVKAERERCAAIANAFAARIASNRNTYATEAALRIEALIREVPS